jgi:hypothetical protein
VFDPVVTETIRAPAALLLIEDSAPGTAGEGRNDPALLHRIGSLDARAIVIEALGGNGQELNPRRISARTGDSTSSLPKTSVSTPA